MGEPIVLVDFKERVILVGVSEQDGDDAEDSLAELAELVKTAGASVAGTLIQKRHCGPRSFPYSKTCSIVISSVLIW